MRGLPHENGPFRTLRQPPRGGVLVNVLEIPEFAGRNVLDVGKEGLTSVVLPGVGVFGYYAEALGFFMESSLFKA